MPEDTATTPNSPDNPPTASAPRIGTIWHFSDIHLDPQAPPGTADKKVTVTAAKADFSVDPWAGLEELAEKEPADLLVFSGDFVDADAIKGKRNQSTLRRDALALARDLIHRLAEAHGLSRRRVVVCPGNHDVDWSIAETDPPASRAAFDDIMREFQRPSMSNPYVEMRQLGLKLLCLDTAYLGGTKFLVSGKKVALDAPAHSMARIQELLDGRRGRRFLVPPDLLGVVIAHHPPGSTPTAIAEVKPFESPIAAEQAKSRLFKAGYTVFLHGHKHAAIAQSEFVYRRDDEDENAQRVLVLGAPALLRDDSGFNVIKYAVSSAGEARLAIQPYTFLGLRPNPTRKPWHLYTHSRSRSAARLARLVERIDELGDCRTDTSYHEIPVPHPGDASEGMGGWAVCQGRMTREVPRVIDAPGGATDAPRVKCTTPPATAEFVHASPNGATRRIHGCIRISAPTGEVKEASILERTFSNAAYATSRLHQARIMGPPRVVTDLSLGWECVVHVVREPVRRLEIFVRLPFEVLHEDLTVRVRTCLENPDGTVSPAEQFTKFSRISIDKALFAKRVRALVSRPLVGVAYSLEWELPHDDPSLDRGFGDRGKYVRAVLEAERLRHELHANGGPDNQATGHPQLIHSAVEEFLEVLRSWGGVSTTEGVEWALFVPDSSLTPLARLDELPAALERPLLKPVCANFPIGDIRWTQTWEVGLGCAGRAYATNRSVWYPHTAGRGVENLPDPESWSHSRVRTYQAGPGGQHALLYSLPVRHPNYRAGNVVLGVFCIGTYDRSKTLRLDTPIPESGEGSILPSESRRLGAEVGAELELGFRIQEALLKIWRTLPNVG